jgi:hypothetical protein
MPGALTPEERWAVERRHGSLDNAVDEALRLAPERCPELQELWDAYTHRWLGPDFWKVFWRLALPVLDIEVGPAEAKHPERAAAARFSNDRPGMKRRSGPDPAFHERDVIGTALSALPSIAKATAESGLHNKDVLRAEKLRDWELLRWDGTTLWADPERVWQRRGRVALRVLNTGGSEWLDPLPLRARP